MDNKPKTPQGLERDTFTITIKPMGDWFRFVMATPDACHHSGDRMTLDEVTALVYEEMKRYAHYASLRKENK